MQSTVSSPKHWILLLRLYSLPADPSFKFSFFEPRGHRVISNRPKSFFLQLSFEISTPVSCVVAEHQVTFEKHRPFSWKGPQNLTWQRLLLRRRENLICFRGNIRKYFLFFSDASFNRKKLWPALQIFKCEVCEPIAPPLPWCQESLIMPYNAIIPYNAYNAL